MCRVRQISRVRHRLETLGPEVCGVSTWRETQNMSATTSVGHVRVQREKHLSFDIFCQKAEEKKNHSERGQFQVRLDKRKYLRPLIISLNNLSPLHISPALCQRASERFANVWHVSLGCEVDAGWIHKTSKKDPTTSPADKIQTVLPKMLVTQFFRLVIKTRIMRRETLSL